MKEMDKMFDLIRDATKMGLGALSLSKENLKKVTDDLTDIGRVSKEEGERLFKEFEESREKYKKDLEEFVEEAVKKAIDRAGLAPKTEVAELRARVAELEETLRVVKEERAVDESEGAGGA